jgi:hypothetical protein
MNGIEQHLLDVTLAFNYGNDRVISKRFYDWIKPTAHPVAIRYIEGVLARRAA